MPRSTLLRNFAVRARKITLLTPLPTNASVPERMTYFGDFGVTYANGQTPSMVPSGFGRR